MAIVGLSLAALASGASLRLTDALLPRLAQDFSISLGQASQVITVFAVAYGLSQVFFGPVGDRFGKVRVVFWACVASAGTALLCALAPGYAALLAGRLLSGITAAGVIPLSMAWIGDSVPYASRQPVLARFLIGQITGFAIGVAAGGYAAEHLDWRTPFFGLATLFLAVAVVLHSVRKRYPQATARAPIESESRPPKMAAEFRAVLSRPWARVVLLTVFLEGACVFSAFAFMPAHLHLRLALPLSTVGALVMLFALGGLGFAFGARTLVRRLGEKLLVRWGAGVLAVMLLTIAAAPGWGWVVPASAAMGLGFYMMHNTLQTHATQMAPERRGAAVAAFAASFFLGQATGVALAGLLVGFVGTGWIIAGSAACVLLVAWNFNRQRKILLVPATGFA
ncbi:MAG: MFS transporter [Rhizobacter sp.]|nr:MFS transporter [Rhizobacter sp.]